MKLFIGRGGLARQILVGPPKKNSDLKKKVNKNYKVQVPLSKQKISTNLADLKKKIGHDGGVPQTKEASWEKSHLVI
jgi:hypothetical protein